MAASGRRPVAGSLRDSEALPVFEMSEPRAIDPATVRTVGQPYEFLYVEGISFRRPLEVPPPVRSWRNAADGRDLVALDQTIVPEYRPADRCTDYLVTNDSGNHHSIEPYLRARPIQDPIRDLMGVPRRG